MVENVDHRCAGPSVWGSPTDWSGIDPRNNGKDRPDQAEDASCSGSTKELRRSETKADGVRGWGQSCAQGLALERGCAIRRNSVDDKLQFVKSPLKSWNGDQMIEAKPDTIG
ncbi:hypothetical protein Tco_1286930 [Tanacetum coccineum]